jgi:hypothetical protein
MTIEQVGQAVTQQPAQQPSAKDAPVIGVNEIKAILYLGIRGKISLPMESHKVDVLA